MESTRKFTVLGAMSGTSLDGLDLVLVQFEHQQEWSFKILDGKTYPYSDSWRSKLVKASNLSGLELKKLDVAFGSFCGETVLSFLNGRKVDFIASHGHTIFHDPTIWMTHQIGDPSAIAAATQCDVIADFRMKDVCLGGQGAPLVPIGDALLFNAFDACVNLGGFANVSMPQEGKRVAWDMCAANIVLNALVAPFGILFDDGGQSARNGTVHPLLLQQLEGLAFFEQQGPKSLGREWVESEIVPLLDLSIPTEDLLATFVEHVAMRISADLSKLNGSVLFTGGGVYNTYLMERITAKSNFTVHIPERQLVEFKEALIFAFLGVLWMQDQPNVLSEVTGASKDHLSGVFVKGK